MCLKLIIIWLANVQSVASTRKEVLVHNWQNLLILVDSIISFFIIEEFLSYDLVLLVNLILPLIPLGILQIRNTGESRLDFEWLLIVLVALEVESFVLVLLVNKLGLILLVLDRLTKAKILIKLDLLHNGNIMRFNLFAGVLFPLQQWCIFFESWSASLSAKHADQLSLRQLAAHLSYKVQQLLTKEVVGAIVDCPEEFLSVWSNLTGISRFDHQTDFGPLLSVNAHSLYEILPFNFVPDSVVKIWTFTISLFLQLVICIIWRLALIIGVFIFLQLISFSLLMLLIGVERDVVVCTSEDLRILKVTKRLDLHGYKKISLTTF